VSGLRHRITASFNASVLQQGWSARGLPLTASQPASVRLLARRERHVRPSTPPRQRPAATVARPSAGYGIEDQKKAYGIPLDLAATHPATLQMVWGPGTFGYSPGELREFRDRDCPGLNVDKVHFDTDIHGEYGGDNFGEGSLDTRMIASFGMNVSTIVSNTNASMSTEEGDGFGYAMLEFITELASRPVVPHVLSLSLGSLSAYSCDLLCDKAAATGQVTRSECDAYLQTQRQVCMFTSTSQVELINQALQVLGLRGTSVLGSSGDGGSHWSFGPFHGFGKVPKVLNQIGCEYNFPIFPSPSPYMTSVGGTEWQAGDPEQPIMWPGSGGGFSWQFKRPSHQDAAVSHYLATAASLPAASSYNASGRGYPDISAVATQGTSESSPTFAGIFSLLIDARLNAGLPPLGFLSPRIWQVAAAFPGAAFEDVTHGNSKTSCSTGFPAAHGWDPTTGWGRPVWKGLVAHFASDTAALRQSSLGPRGSPRRS